MTLASAVLDSSVVVRAAAAGAPDARRWTAAVEAGEVDALAPELIYAEVANALRAYVAAGLFSPATARGILERILRIPVESRRLSELVPAALAVALARGLSVYDALYVVLAEAADAQLVTADRQLAAAAEHSILIE